jgi:hypothetical protein
MKEIQEAIRKLEPNKPVFRVTLVGDEDTPEDGKAIKLILLNKMDRSIRTDDAILNAVNRRYYEWLNVSDKKFEVHIRAMEVFNNEILDFVKSVYKKNSPLREPKMSKIYRFLKSIYSSNNANITNVMVSLYKHLIKVTNQDKIFLDGKDGQSAIQFNHIMNKMVEKYGKK